MSIGIDTYCFQCHMRRNIDLARSLGTEEKATEFAKELMKLYVNTPAGYPTPGLTPATSQLLHDMYGLDLDRFRQEKADSNQFVLSRLPQIQEKVFSAADPVLAGLQFAILGNYLDFSALEGQISFQELDDMLAKALEMQLDTVTVDAFRADLARGKKLIYLTDNAGEIGFDRVFAEALAKAYPHLEITFCVRGGIANNDATQEDAEMVGIPFPVIGNGSNVPGTILEEISAEARNALETADVILAKGMGNTETLLSCGLNVYYAFLVKCPRFVHRFDKPMMTPMFVRELGAE